VGQRGVAPAVGVDAVVFKRVGWNDAKIVIESPTKRIFRPSVGIRVLIWYWIVK